MSRRRQEGKSLRTVYDASENRRVCFVKNPDGTFGFLQWTFSEVDDSWLPTRVGAGSRFETIEDATRDAEGRVPWFGESNLAPVIYQLSWTTLPGLRGLSVSEFRAMPTDTPDNERGVAVEFVSEAVRDEFLQATEAEFASRRFTNTADAFDGVKAWILQHAPR